MTGSRSASSDGFVLYGAGAGVRITDIVAGRGGQLPPGGAGGVTGAIVGLVSTLLHRGGGAAALVLGLAAAGALSGCSAAQTLNAKPVWGMRSDLEFGRCAYAGTWVGTAPGARTCRVSECTDGIDNDGDGLMDCQDPSCQATMTCAPGMGGPDAPACPGVARVEAMADEGAALAAAPAPPARAIPCVRLDLPRRDARGMRLYGVGGETKVEIAQVDDLRGGVR